MIDVKSIPDALKEGESWPMLDLDWDWVWLARDADDRVCGLLIAAPCHGLVFLWRLKMLPSAPSTALLHLLRRFFRDLRQRGMLGYLMFLDLLRPEEQALARIAFRAGAISTPASTVLCGSINVRHAGGE